MIRNAIWDFDGTLFDTYPAIGQAFQQALADFGAYAPLSEIEGLARVEMSYCTAELAARFDLDRDDLIRRFAERHSTMPLAGQPPFPGVREVCETIAALGGVNAIVTHRGAESTAGLLAEHGMQALFAEVVTRDDGYPRKPDPAAFLAILRNQHLDARETLAIGDRELDILAGRAAGLLTCLFRDGPKTVPADIAIRDFKELLAIFDPKDAKEAAADKHG
jgi:phosphoglycolate phosphatase-like HAD superfamily hydrolase